MGRLSKLPVATQRTGQRANTPRRFTRMDWGTVESLCLGAAMDSQRKETCEQNSWGYKWQEMRNAFKWRQKKVPQRRKQLLAEGWRRQHKGGPSFHPQLGHMSKQILDALPQCGLKAAWKGAAALWEVEWVVRQAKGRGQAGGASAGNYGHLRMTLVRGFCPTSSSSRVPLGDNVPPLHYDYGSWPVFLKPLGK